MQSALRAGVMAMVTTLASCSSVPTHFYTLLTPPSNAPVPEASFAIHVEPVVVPAENDQAAWLVRVSPSEVAVLDGQRWAAPLSDELRAAFADTLQEQLGARDVDASGTMKTKYIIHIAIRRFESVPGQQALIDADWSVRGEGSVVLMCTSQASQRVAAGYAALAAGHQQIVRTMALQMASAVRAMEAHHPACPPI
jgi:uncharacterized protein